MSATCISSSGADRSESAPIFTCIDCEQEISANRRVAIQAHGLAKRCIRCQERQEKERGLRPRLEDVKGLAVGSAYDSTDEHREDMQGVR